MKNVGTDLIIAVGAIICIAYGSLVIATKYAINDDLNALLGLPQKVANQQHGTIIKDSDIGSAGSLGNDLQNYVTYSANGAIASVVVGVLQLTALLFKYAFHTYYQTTGGRR